jgi:hypothetical protein
MESNMTKREKELQSLRNRIKRLEKIRDQAIRDLVMTETRLPALRKKALRLVEAVLKRRFAVPEEFKVQPKESAEAEVTATAPADDGLDIPEYLKRQYEERSKEAERIEERARRLLTLPDPRTKEKKAQRRAVEKEKREAELRGKTRKMPLTGKAALDAIRDSH